MSSTPEDRPRQTSRHKPVLLRETIQQLQLEPGMTVVDGTVGGGGHSQQVLKQIGKQGTLICLDRDPMMLQLAQEKVSGANVILKHSSYAELHHVLEELEIPGVDRILVDLGLSSDQLEHEERGFGFSTSGDLDMRFDTTKGISAAELINTESKNALTDIFQNYGEERYAADIADAILRSRNQEPIQTVTQLNTLVEQALPKHILHQSDKHPATRVYQALRIAVNEELQHVERAVTEIFPRCLNPNGTLVVITFHSLEDRLVKNAFQDETKWENLTTKAITPRPNEQKMNPRSRSAKIRAARKIIKKPLN